MPLVGEPHGAPLVGTDDLDGRAVRLLDEVGDADPEPVDEPHEAADGDVALPLLDHREERRRDPGALGDLGEGDAARPPELAAAACRGRRADARPPAGGCDRLESSRRARYSSCRRPPRSAWRSSRISASCATTRRCQRSSSIERARQAVSTTRLVPGSPTIVARDDTRADPPDEPVGVAADLVVHDPLLRYGNHADDGLRAVEEGRSRRHRPVLRARLPAPERPLTEAALGRRGTRRHGRDAPSRARTRNGRGPRCVMNRASGGADGAPRARRLATSGSSAAG